MVNPALQAAIAELTYAERRELLAYLEQTLEVDVELTEEQRDLIRSRDAEADTDPSLLRSLDEHRAFVRSLLA